MSRAVDRHEVWVAELAGFVVGWVEIDDDRVEALYVGPDSARRGIGSMLLLRAESLIRGRGLLTAALVASPNAEGFYLRRGYELQAHRASDGGRSMLKHLPKP